ncbi:pyrroline-5-carboxylate reductase [Hyphomicrobium sp.]|uniref:pyrroline-5-carboxylate reductase n=1 Tax=Hyphomicrobium sp. TaxID=82 RepID=UPI000F9D1681|nr:pyrroline-5-carboxylate reductase [Hyphomicrobium sp.]RUO99483.1 MAG: pyrroline-5-carboxylate reductase [Hyphomicrobium sp.]
MSLNLNGSVVLAGAGKMGGAMLAGWLDRGLLPSQVLIQEPHLTGSALELAQRRGIVARATFGSETPPPAVIVVAVKPQVIDEVFPALAKLAGPETVVVSIAAGKTIASFERYLPAGAAVVRAMPNTPAAIGRGITGAVANSHTSAAQRANCEALLGAVGEVVWVPSEDLIDAVTAVSGSGPAYVFLLAEALAEAGVAVGLDPATAKRLAIATVSGAGELMHQSGIEPTTLRQNVTSPGGTTAAALNVLMRDGDGLRELMLEAVQAAQKRGRELGR